MNRIFSSIVVLAGVAFFSSNILNIASQGQIDSTNFPTTYQCTKCGSWHPYGMSCPSK